jgi:polyferredoxin
VMFDKDTPVSYDYERGEPVACKKGHQSWGSRRLYWGQMCAQVCPTGIDIRDGLQVVCIQCAACTMLQWHHGIKLAILVVFYSLYDWKVVIEKAAELSFRPRLFAYLALLLVLCGGLVFALTDRVPLKSIFNVWPQSAFIDWCSWLKNSYIIKN